MWLILLGPPLLWSVRFMAVYVLVEVACRTGFLGVSLLGFAIAIQGGLLSALIVFAPAPLYPIYGGDQAAALADQQLAGAIMWAPSGLICCSFGLPPCTAARCEDMQTKPTR